MVADLHVPREHGAVGEHDPRADAVVVRDVGEVHEVVVVADHRLAAAARRAAMDRHELAEHVAGADDEPRRLAAVLQVLRIGAERRVRVDPVVRRRMSRGPGSDACAPTRVRAPSTTPSPMTAYGPICDALAEDRAVRDRRRSGWITFVMGGPPGRERSSASAHTRAVHGRRRAALADRASSARRARPRCGAGRPARPAAGTCSGRPPRGRGASSPCRARRRAARSRATWAMASSTSTPGITGLPGKVALEELLVESHVLDPDDALARLELEDPVHEQERVAVRQDLHDLADPDLHALLLSELLLERRQPFERLLSRPSSAARLRNSRCGRAGIPEATAPASTLPCLAIPACPVRTAPSPIVTWSEIPTWPASVTPRPSFDDPPMPACPQSSECSPTIDVVSDLHEVVDLGAPADDGLAERRAVDRGIRPDLDVVLDAHDSDLRDLAVRRSVPDVPEAVRRRPRRPPAGRSARRSGTRREPPRWDAGCSPPRWRHSRPRRRRPRAPSASRRGRRRTPWPREPPRRRARAGRTRWTKAPRSTPAFRAAPWPEDLEPGREGELRLRHDDAGLAGRRFLVRNEQRSGRAARAFRRAALVGDPGEIRAARRLESRDARQVAPIRPPVPRRRRRRRPA